MRVIATAGHVDHGKSTLVRSLTGMEPDRWAEERRRGMTIDLGYAWTTLPGGEQIAFVDVPGHQRFLSNMLAGVGPAPAVMFVVAADEGWRRQSEEHLAAIDALGIEIGLLVITRADLADPRPARAEASERISRSSLGRVDAVAVSAVTGAGLDQLRAALGVTVARLVPPVVDGPVRLWIDRVFSMSGSGTVVTSTLGSGCLSPASALELNGDQIGIRTMQSLGKDVTSVSAVARVALNLRGVARAGIRRGDALLTPGAWHQAQHFDAVVRPDLAGLSELTLHIGSAAVPARVRTLDGDLVRVSLHRPLPLRAGDRAVLREPGQQRIVASVQLLDVDPPQLQRRGAARQRAAELRDHLVAAGSGPGAVLRAEVRRRGAVTAAYLSTLGVAVADRSQVRRVGDWLVDPDRWRRWSQELQVLVQAFEADHPTDAGIPAEAARRALGLPDRELLGPLIAQAGLQSVAGRVRLAGDHGGPDLRAEAMRRLAERLRQSPFAAPERSELDELGLSPRALAAAESAGTLIRLTPEVVLLADAPQRALDVLAGLAQPFTTSQARIALGTTRRVTVPLLEHLDALGATRRLDAMLREIV